MNAHSVLFNRALRPADDDDDPASRCSVNEDFTIRVEGIGQSAFTMLQCVRLQAIASGSG